MQIQSVKKVLRGIAAARRERRRPLVVHMSPEDIVELKRRRRIRACWKIMELLTLSVIFLYTIYFMLYYVEHRKDREECQEDSAPEAIRARRFAPASQQQTVENKFGPAEQHDVFLFLGLGLRAAHAENRQNNGAAIPPYRGYNQKH